MGPLGWQETLFIFVLALLIFGPKKLPELGKTIGKALTEFRRASSDLKATFDREMATIEKESESIKEVTSQYSYDPYSYHYDSTYDYGTTGPALNAPASEATAALPPSTSGASATPGAELPAAPAQAAPALPSAAPVGTVAAGSIAPAPANGTDGTVKS